MDEIVRDHITALYLKVNEYYESDDYCDVHVRVEERVFKCHRLILAAACEYFHLMFSGNFKERTASEVILQEIEANTFQETLKFIYTGKVSISNSNLYNLVRASEFFKLPRIEELFIQYVQQNEDELIENVLEIFSYARATGRTSFVDVLNKYICKHFDHFSKTAEFLEIAFDDFITILNLINSSTSTIHQDVFMSAVIRWIRRTDHSLEERKSYFDRFLQRINFARLSSGCVEYLARLNFEDYIALKESIGKGDTQSPSETTLSESEKFVDYTRLHVFVNAYSEDEPDRFVTSIFTLYRQFEDQKWVNSYRYDYKYSSDFMRSVVLDNHLYCLEVSIKTPITSKSIEEMGSGVQTFKKCSSVSLFSNTHLKPPPLILYRYDMCGFGENICVYNRNTWSVNARSRPTTSSFDDEQLYRGVYLYNREIDTWLPLPPLKKKCAGACMTCDERILYLIGGTDSNKYVQSYDHRTPTWLAVAPTAEIFENAACCVHRNKIYVCGGYQNPNRMEMYNPTAGKWETMRPMNQGRSNHQIQMFLHSNRHLVTSGDLLTPTMDMEFYNITENSWKYMTPLYKPVMDSGLPFTNYLKVLDMVTFKPLGL